eukprot:comp8011_c0_seq1/m.3518 comp8011_c0_seq1/g.3518  ORF comp8011_c0_seq1/g.3518 comp8011_c0_seq1/m.3518 type:complete len:164 (-) comp8011_c0_seq1:121-612(-)
MMFQNQPSRVDYKDMHFLIFDAPTDSNLPNYMKEFKNHGVTDVVRVCDPTYNAHTLEATGIQVHDWMFADGDAPPAHVIRDWLALLKRKFAEEGESTSCIGVHCVAGLGRAPILVAIALMEKGMAAEDAVQYIRKVRPGALNSKQIKFVQKYKPHRKKDCVIQ